MDASESSFDVVGRGCSNNEALTYTPDYDECRASCSDYLDASEKELPDEFEAEYIHYEIGEGESGTDTIFDDETLLKWYGTDTFEEAMEQHGYDTEVVINGKEYVRLDDCEV